MNSIGVGLFHSNAMTKTRKHMKGYFCIMNL